MSKPKTKPRGNRRLKEKDNPTRSIRTSGNREKILKVLRKTACSLSAAAIACHLGESSVYDWQKADEDFKKDVQEAITGPGTDVLEDVAVSHAAFGVEEPVIFQGALQYVTIPEVEEEEDEDGKVKQVIKVKFKLDKSGNPIPLTVRKWDHGLITRMLDRRRPMGNGGLGDQILNLADEIREARMRAGVKE